MNIRLLITFCLASLLFSSCATRKNNAQNNLNFYNAANNKLQYIGRIDFSNPLLPKMWAGGIYINAKFKGPACEVIINDEYGSNNYLEIVVDGKASRVQIKGKTDTLKVAEGLSNTEHTLTICKDTESNIGYIEFAGLRCNQLLTPPAKPERKIEFIGNSITSGTGSDLSEIPCGKGKWHDQHNAYFSYGPTTARMLNSQWHLTSYSGIGLIHSCCNIKTTMPEIFDKVVFNRDSIQWDFSRYIPDAVTICLGQNDGVQDSAKFCNAYVSFIKRIRSHYPKAQIICLSSPMADETLVKVLKNYISSIVDYENANGDKKVYKYFFTKRYHHGCDEHPDLAEHKEIANELASFFRQKLNW